MTLQLGGLDRDRPRTRCHRRLRPRIRPRARLGRRSNRSNRVLASSSPRVGRRRVTGDVRRRRERFRFRSPGGARDPLEREIVCVFRARVTRSTVDRRAGTSPRVSSRSSCGVSRARGKGRGRPRARGAIGDAREGAWARGDGGRRRARRRAMGRRRRRGRRERRERAVIQGMGAVGEGTGRSRGMEMVV